MLFYLILFIIRFWFPDYPGISNPDVFTKWMQSAMTQIETNFYSDYPTVTLKIQNTIANSTYLPEIIQQALQGTSPLSSQLAGGIKYNAKVQEKQYLFL